MVHDIDAITSRDKFTKCARGMEGTREWRTEKGMKIERGESTYVEAETQWTAID